MTNPNIDEMFERLITHFGRDEVQRRLEVLIENADLISKANTRSVKKNKNASKKSKIKSAKEYVDSMKVPTRRKEKLYKLAERFDRKSFLPTISDIKNLFYTQGADASTIKARQTAVPRVFFFLSSIPEDRLDAILADQAFSGPSRLEPIANAIKSRGNIRRNEEQKDIPDDCKDNVRQKKVESGHHR